jgi:hypothetical protein
MRDRLGGVQQVVDYIDSAQRNILLDREPGDTLPPLAGLDDRILDEMYLALAFAIENARAAIRSYSEEEAMSAPGFPSEAERRRFLMLAGWDMPWEEPRRLMNWLAEHAVELERQSDASKSLVVHLNTVSADLRRGESS